jgi:hypothetical protein
MDSTFRRPLLAIARTAESVHHCQLPIQVAAIAEETARGNQARPLLHNHTGVGIAGTNIR